MPATRLPERVEDGELLLRRWWSEDAEALARVVAANEEHLRPWMPWMEEEPLALHERTGLIERWEADWEGGGDVVLGIFRDGEILGSCGLHRRLGPEGLEIGYWVSQAHLREGIATRAAGALAGAALALPGVERVEIHHDKANVASAGVPPKLGFELVGETIREPKAPAEVGVELVWRLEKAR